TAEAGAIDLYVGQDRVSHLNFPANAQEVLVLNVPDAEKVLKSGTTAVRVEISGKKTLPYTLARSCPTAQAQSAAHCPGAPPPRRRRSTVRSPASAGCPAPTAAPPAGPTSTTMPT